MKAIDKQSGFTTIELLITLFVAAAFLISGYQLYSLVINDSGEARAQAQASNVAYDYLQRYKSSVSNPCVQNLALVNNQPVTVENLSNATITVAVTCPYTSPNSVSKITATIKYNDPQITVSSATYATK